MNTVEEALRILTEARAIISDGDRWIQRDYARDRRGHPVTPDRDSGAYRFCATGAVHYVAGTFTRTMAFPSPALLVFSQLSHEARKRGWDSLQKANDSFFGGLLEVLAIYDAAIAALSPAKSPIDEPSIIATPIVVPEPVVAG